MPVDLLDPYAGNILTKGLGPIRSSVWVREQLTVVPQMPQGVCEAPREVRLHHLIIALDAFHIPPGVEGQLYESMDLMLRSCLHRRNPDEQWIWSNLSGEGQRRNRPPKPAPAALVDGLSGSGKSDACHGCLGLFKQLIPHESFPRLVGGLQQVVWQSAEVPPSGKSGHLAQKLMKVARDTTGERRFDDWLGKANIPDGMLALNEWLGWAKCHVLGLLHLDEIQNLFKLSPLRQRLKKGASAEPELAIVEDQVLRWILSVINSGLPLLVSGTSDGTRALSRRLSTMQRITTGGAHLFDRFVDPKATDFYKLFLTPLSKLQFVKKPLPVSEEFADLIIELTAGVKRIIIGLWMAAHRIAFRRGADALTFDDFRLAAATLLAPVAPAVAVLRGTAADKERRYEDLVKNNDEFWNEFWAARI